MNDLGILTGILAIIIFHLKLFSYYRFKKPNGSIFLAYLKGEIILYITLSFFPVSLKKNKDFKEKIKRINNLTYLFYTLIVIAFSLGLVAHYKT